MTDPIDHGNDGPPSDAPEGPFGALVDSLVTLYLLGRDVIPDGALITIHADHDDDHDIFLLKIGIGPAANTVMIAEREAAQAPDGGE